MLADRKPPEHGSHMVPKPRETPSQMQDWRFATFTPPISLAPPILKQASILQGSNPSPLPPPPSLGQIIRNVKESGRFPWPPAPENPLFDAMLSHVYAKVVCGYYPRSCSSASQPSNQPARQPDCQAASQPICQLRVNQTLSTRCLQPFARKGPAAEAKPSYPPRARPIRMHEAF